MPPPEGKTKKKGRAPAHQNKFAFAHNPKSKTTERILASPIFHVCQRCHDKLEWRKTYRKYKPRTQPGTCNGCRKRNVKAAYHTICDSCTRSSVKAKELFAPTATEGEEPVAGTPSAKLRACAVCVKELALPDSDDEEDDLADQVGRIRLRERKAMERKVERDAKEAKEARKAARATDVDEEDGADHANRYNNDTSDAGDDSSKDVGANDGLEEEDPFLKAVGGADKLLTGEAYQEKLLAEQAGQLPQLET
jgi:hypothetical protein